MYPTVDVHLAVLAPTLWLVGVASLPSTLGETPADWGDASVCDSVVCGVPEGGSEGSGEPGCLEKRGSVL